MRAKWPISAEAYPGFCSEATGWDASPSQVTPSIKFAGTHLYTWVERGAVKVKCLAQEHNAMSQARARTQTARSGDERTSHEDTASPKCNGMLALICLSDTFYLLVPEHFFIPPICPQDISSHVYVPTQNSL